MENIFPDEIFVEIASHNKWICSGIVARTCKYMLKFFTNPKLLYKIINTITAENLVLYKWLTFALPAEWLGSDIIYHKLKEFKIDIPIITSDRLPFVTGGIVCQKIYWNYWNCDIDVFYIGDIDDPQPRKEVQIFDLIPTEYRETERCIENFDLSIVQQGFSDKGIFCTALALYSYYYKNILVIPEKKVHNYNGFTKMVPRLEKFHITIY
jgi:hypothetical protein